MDNVYPVLLKVHGLPIQQVTQLPALQNEIQNSMVANKVKLYFIKACGLILLYNIEEKVKENLTKKTLFEGQYPEKISI